MYHVFSIGLLMYLNSGKWFGSVLWMILENCIQEIGGPFACWKAKEKKMKGKEKEKATRVAEMMKQNPVAW